MPNAVLQLATGSPGLIALGANNLYLGTEGAGDVNCLLGSATSSFKVLAEDGTVLLVVNQPGDSDVGAISTATITVDAGAFVLMPVAATVSAAGSDITDATALTAAYNAITTVAASSGVKLPVAAIGATVVVQNLGANDLEVYPPTALGTLNAASAGDPITLAAATDDILTARKISATAWICGVQAGPAT